MHQIHERSGVHGYKATYSMDKTGDFVEGL